MVRESLDITVPLINGKIISFRIKSKSPKSLFIMDGAELEESEAQYQIVEGKCYDYKIDEGYFLKDSFGIVSGNDFDKSVGRIEPNIYVGTLRLDIFYTGGVESLGSLKLEVQSEKTEYRSDYRKMLADITDECIELVFQHSSPITQVVDVDYENDNKTWHQRFAFIKSVIDTEEFNEAVNKIISAPVTKWEEARVDKDIRRVRRLTGKVMQQIASASNRIILSEEHPLRSETIKSVPAKIKITAKTETVDTFENRFVKHALQSFLFFASDFKSKLKSDNKTKLEADKIENKLEQFLSHSVFKEISDPTTIILSSPILQRKEGYREVLRIWLMFNLAAQLCWKGGDDVYDIEKRNVAVLYEYWLFFQLLKIVANVFGIKPGKNLIVDTNDKLGLQLKQGKYFPVSGVCEKYNRRLQVQFSYNRVFGGSSEEYSYPSSGSWTRSMRPDYSLSIWPANISEEEAEKQELITHLHFDAKYKIENIIEHLSEEKDLDKEKEEQSKGTYKRADLLKMHSYKDAIRRTGGAYILYPGNKQTRYSRMGFRELIPGLGAFQIRPSENGDTGSKAVEKFFEDVVYHFLNRTSQREKTAYRIFDIHQFPPNPKKELRELLPELSAINRDFFPDEIFVLVGYSTSDERFKWYEENGKYVFRMDDMTGSLELDNEVVNAKYLLLRKSGEEVASALFKIKSRGPKVFSKIQLEKLDYPLSRNPKEYYLIIEIEPTNEEEFRNKVWKFKELSKYKAIIKDEKNLYSRVGMPFTVSLLELMNVVKKE